MRLSPHARWTLLPLLASACTCGPPSFSGYTVSLTATTSVPADGVSTSALVLTVLDSHSNPAPGLNATFSSSRGSTDTVVQPPPTGSDGKCSGSVSSSTTGIAIISLSLDGEARPEVAPVRFVPVSDGGAPDGSGTAPDGGQPDA